MPRRKKIEADGESSDLKRGAKKSRRVDLKIRISKPVPENRQELEEEYGEVIETSDNLTQKAIDEDAVSPETVEEIANKIAELKNERDKKIFMWIGVTFIMSIVLVVWVYNLKNMFRQQANQNQAGKEMNIDKISEDLKKTMEEVNKDLNKLNEISVASSSLASTSETAKLSDATSTTSFEETADIQELRARLEELERRLNLPATTTGENKLPPRR
jgi:cytoskeletal protein RodZ